jgi:hypothetical protein
VGTRVGAGQAGTGQRGARGDRTGAPAGSVGDRLLGLGDGPTLGDV